MNFLFFFLQHARRISPIFVHRNFDLVSIGRVSRRKERSPRNNVLERAFSNVPGGHTGHAYICVPRRARFSAAGCDLFPPLLSFFSINSRSLGLSIFGINCLEKRRPREAPPKCPDDFSSTQFPPVPHRSRHE